MSCTRRSWLAGAAALASASHASFAAGAQAGVPILAYHRFASTRNDSMTVRTSTFDAHLRLLESLGAQCVPLSALVAAWCGSGPALPERAVVLTADDGHRSQFDVMVPRLVERRLPVTLFIYPSAISNATYAMRWPELRSLRDRGVELQSHTYWHPNLVRDRQTMEPERFEREARFQLQRSRARLEQELERPVTLLAWPFGMTDGGLKALARDAGYQAAFALGNRAARSSDDRYGFPRHLMTEDVGARQLGQRLQAAWSGSASAA